MGIIKFLPFKNSLFATSKFYLTNAAHNFKSIVNSLKHKKSTVAIALLIE